MLHNINETKALGLRADAGMIPTPSDFAQQLRNSLQSALCVAVKDAGLYPSCFAG